MIPKKFHYIWLGGKELPEMVKKCMETWNKFCPDYEIIRWDETNLNLDVNKYCRQAYDAKKYAFASDVLRFEILKQEGGIYLDVDVELMKNLDDLLDCKAFAGLEQWGKDKISLAPGLIFASEKGGKVVTDISKMYKEEVFVKENGELNYETVCDKTTKYLVQNLGLTIENKMQNLDEITIYPTEYFCPLNFVTKEENVTQNTYSKHLYLGSWVPKPKLKVRVLNFIKKVIKKVLGEDKFDKLKKKIKDKK